LVDDPELAAKFDTDADSVHAGVCSIQTVEGDTPWIVCPRRLLALGRHAPGVRQNQSVAEQSLLRFSGYSSGTRVGIWPEVKIKIDVLVNGDRKRFDYTFDYVLMPLGPLEVPPEGLAGLDIAKLRSAGWESIPTHGRGEFIEGPDGSPTIVEIMTSSTSGGNKRKGTTIPQAFRESVMTGSGAVGPGINYRQVWARMASQLIVKSEAAMAWDGRTVWVIQDHLADYITKTTALDLEFFESAELNEVNMLSLPFDHATALSEGVANLRMFAGPIKPEGAADTPSFSDIVRAAAIPPRSALMRALLARAPSQLVVVT
jgi:hypothetical protein